MTLTNELERLQAMREAGSLTEEEFLQAKSTLMRQQEASHTWNTGAAPPPPVPPTVRRSTEDDTRTWSILLHVSQFAWFIPMGGLLAPLVIWLVQKERLPGLTPHFYAVMNWALSAIIYAICCIPLVFILIGFIPLIAIGVLSLIFPIVGAIKASNGEVWPYPLSIRFFS